MKIADHIQLWKGYFTYQDGYEAIDQYIEVPFSMKLTFNGTSFTGESTDAESETIFDKPATVKGFVEEHKISFVLQYPYAYFKDEDGTLVLDKKAKHPEIRYFGILDEDNKGYIGMWEMTVYEEKYFDDYLEEVANGTFEMRRVK